MTRVVKVAIIGLLSSTEIDVSDIAMPDELARRIRHEAYENGLLVRISRDSERIGIFFYPPLVVGDEDIVRGVAALESVLRRI